MVCNQDEYQSYQLVQIICKSEKNFKGPFLINSNKRKETIPLFFTIYSYLVTFYFDLIILYLLTLFNQLIVLF